MRTDAHLNPLTRDPDHGFPAPGPRLGNDVVDLQHRTCRERDRDDRLLERILTPEERSWLSEESERDPWLVRLWALWAAKETAFKVVSKLSEPPPVFRHRGFRCELELAPGECRGVIRVRGVVRGPEVPGEVTVQGSSDGEHIHLVGWGAGRGPAPTLEAGLEGSREREGELEAYRPLFSGLEWEGIRTVQGAEARLRARARVEAWLGPSHGTDGEPGPTPSAVEIVTSGERPGRTPPRIRFRGVERPDLDLSLSHHGRFVAWAILVPPEHSTGDADDGSEPPPTAPAP